MINYIHTLSVQSNGICDIIKKNVIHKISKYFINLLEYEAKNVRYRYSRPKRFRKKNI